MTLEIKVGVPTLTIHQGYTIAASEPDGQMHGGGTRGLYFLDTRLISTWEISANGKPWTLLNSGALAASAGRIYLTNPDLQSEGGTIPAQAISFVLGRHVDGGMHEDIDITNHGADSVRFDLTLAIGGDFADLFEVKGHTVTTRGKTFSDWQVNEQTLTTRYRNKEFSRAFRVTAKNARSPMSLANGKLQFGIELAPGEKWQWLSVL